MGDLGRFFIALAVTALVTILLFNSIDNHSDAGRAARPAPDAPWLTPELASVPR
jgi:hypothetical protein